MRIKDKGLRKAIKFFGSEKKLGEALGISQQKISYWLNWSKNPPVEYILKIDYLTHSEVSYHEFFPRDAEICKILDYFRNKNNSKKRLLKDIIRGDASCAFQSRRGAQLLSSKTSTDLLPLVIDESNCLISCVCRYDYLCQQDSQYAKTIIFDIDAFLHLGEDDVLSHLARYPISERLAMVDAVVFRINEARASWCPNSDAPGWLCGRADEYIARAIGIGMKTTFYSAKMVLAHGNATIINLMDHQNISIDKAKKFSLREINGFDIANDLQLFQTSCSCFEERICSFSHVCEKLNVTKK